MARLLIVDDERNIRRSLATFFESLGHEVRAAESGPQAIAMLAETRFDLVLTDYRMAEMSGLELLHEIKRRAPESLVILMTAFGYDPSHCLVKAHQEGLRFVLYKPFRVDQLLDALEKSGSPPRNESIKAEPVNA